MKKVLLFFIISLLGLPNLMAQEEPTSAWTKGADLSFALSQVSLSNWAAGGEGSVAINAFGNFKLNYKEGKNDWQNKLELAYGMINSGNTEYKKSDDKIHFESKYGYQASKKLYYTAILSFRSQFIEGYNYPANAEKVYLSNFLAPGYLNFSLGINWKANEFFSVFVGPISPKLTIVNDEVLSQQGAFGVEVGEKTRFEMGGVIIANFKKEVVKNVELATNLELYTNYLKNPQNIDVNWDMMIIMKVNKYLSANISTNLLYDDDIMITDNDGNIGPRVQFKEVVGVGITVKL